MIASYVLRAYPGCPEGLLPTLELVAGLQPPHLRVVKPLGKLGLLELLLRPFLKVLGDEQLLCVLLDGLPPPVVRSV